ncbi:hypothetical protein FA15DRAFT_649183 [Coprinopsis marcescibilis]|uniref:Actin-like ATPase domain-containing protein n=1 Tax=Coprinopsis marcescibilis TaxID=230819 RepID=A0A5C3KFJ3_COPMA|nr:hypothetical protein FA15DRAFT_649183 [Coprinopsis marcescibilis]
MPPDTRPPYSGTNRKLVLALDVGTTYSGISYCILDPGQVPEVKGVTKFPAQEHISGASKIPTVLYYNQAGEVCAAGAETMRDGIQDMAEDEGWIKVEWFKLHIRPKSDVSSHVTSNIPPLPPGRTAVSVLADFLKYLYQCGKAFIEETHINGEALWRMLEPTIDYVITHPNGWEGYQQSQIRNAVVLAKMIPDTPNGHARVTFVTEGEASLHFCIESGLMSGNMALKEGEGVIVVDAGGGTIDISSYQVSKQDGSKQTFREVITPACHFFGSVFVSVNARIFLKKLLEDSIYLEDLDHIVDRFDKVTKLRFRVDTQTQYIKFGATRDNDPLAQIRNGQLKLAGTDVAEFFESSIKCILKAVAEINTNLYGIKHVVLVGGFSASDWLYTKVKDALGAKGLAVLRPEYHINKAVSDGAVTFFLGRSVESRIAKFAYGIRCGIAYSEENPEHRARKESRYNAVDGSFKLIHFEVLVPKGTALRESTEISNSDYTYMVKTRGAQQVVRIPIRAYRGINEDPEWEDNDPENYLQLCTIVVDERHLDFLPALSQKTDGSLGLYWSVPLTFIVSFGDTEMRAQVAWLDKGVEKRSPSQIIYDPNDV